MGSALLSRFDLVFILLDIPDEDHDHMVSDHVIAMRSGKTAVRAGATVRRTGTQESEISILEAVGDKPLSESLKVDIFHRLSSTWDLYIYLEFHMLNYL